MAPFSLLFIALALASSHGVLGAPSCSTDLGSCISKCKSKWHHHHSMSLYPYSVGPQKGNSVSGTMSETPTPTPGPTSPPGTQPKPTTTPASSISNPASPSPSSNGDSSGISSSDKQAILAAHNNLRSTHGANPLTWSDPLQSTALAWAMQCKFQHSQGQYGGTYLSLMKMFYLKPVYRESFCWHRNAHDCGRLQGLGAGRECVARSTLGYSIRINVFCSTEGYDPSNPQFSHYTQIVWKATTQLGCAYVNCPSGTIFPDSVRADFLHLFLVVG
jgi:hypothetical protein